MFPFSFLIARLGHAARAMPALVMSSGCHRRCHRSRLFACLPLGNVPHRHSLRLSSVRPSSSRRLAPLDVSGDGEPTGLLACLMMSLPVVWRWRRGHALDVERRRGSFCRASVALTVLLLLMRWRRGYRAGFFDDAAAGRGAVLA